VEEVYNWLIQEFAKNISLYKSGDENYFPTLATEEQDIDSYYKKPVFYGYRLFMEDDDGNIIDDKSGERKYVLQKAAEFTKVKAAWQIPWKNLIHDHDKTKTDNIIDRGMFCRLIETDAVFIKNVIDDILKDRKRVGESAKNSDNDTFTRYFREEDYNDYLSEPVFRSHMRFMARSVNHKDDILKHKYLTKPYVYVRTHVKNPYMYQDLISLNSDNLYDATINTIRPTLPALFITEAGELCYVDMFLAKAKKKLPKPDEMMGYYALLDLEGNEIIPTEIICNYSFRKQHVSVVFDTTYFFIYTKDDKRRLLMTNSNLIPLYDISISTPEAPPEPPEVTLHFDDTSVITGGGQLTRPDYWYDPYLRDEEHNFENYSFNGAINNVGKLHPEFNEDATSYNYDYLEFLKERRIYDLQLEYPNDKNTLKYPPYIKAIADTNKMEDTSVFVSQETTTGEILNGINEHKYPKLNKIYYYNNDVVFRYDPASRTEEQLTQVASICGSSNVFPVDQHSATTSLNTKFLTSYETYENLKKNAAADPTITLGPSWFFWGIGVDPEDGPWSTDYPTAEKLLLKELEILSTSSAGDVISQSKEPQGEEGAVLTDPIMTIKVTMETKQEQYLVRKGIFAEKNAEGKMHYVKYDVEIIKEPEITSFTGSSTICASFKINRFTGINFDNLISSNKIELTNFDPVTITKYENTETHFRFLYYLESSTEFKGIERTNEFKAHSENVDIFSRIKEDITITKTIAVGTIYDRGEWDYPGTTWKYNSSKTFGIETLKKDFDYLKPLYYYTNSLTPLGNTYNQSNILAISTLNRLLPPLPVMSDGKRDTSEEALIKYQKQLDDGTGAFVNSSTGYFTPSLKQFGFNETVLTTNVPFGINNSQEQPSPTRFFSHGFLFHDAFYTFKQQPCYDKEIPSNNPSPPYESSLHTIPLTEATLAYPRLSGSTHGTIALFHMEQDEADVTEGTGNDKKVIDNKKLKTTGWDFSLEPPKSLVHPIPTQFTIIGPHYNSPVQPAAYKQFVNQIVQLPTGTPPTTYTENLYIENHMMIYYIPSDPILNEADVVKVGAEKSLNFHFKGVSRGVKLTNTQRFKVLSENTHFMGSIDLVGATEFPESRTLKFSTKANIGTFRLKIQDDLEIIKNPKTGEKVPRTDQSPLIKIWPRTLPIKYQLDTDGIFHRVSNWTLGFLPAPKSNYHLRFFRKEEPDQQINLDEPFDPQYSTMKIKKVNSSLIGDNDLAEQSMEVSFWNIAYGGSPYIPKTIDMDKATTVEFNGVGSYPYYWYIVNTDKTYNVAMLLPVIEDGVANKRKQKIVPLEKGKFKLCVTDGAAIFYTSPEIEIK
jgi:hypothetical protein